MFHHFHNSVHLPAQGSLSAIDFKKMLDWLAKNYSLFSAQEYLERAQKGYLQHSDICLSFDDGLKSQYDIALPIMKDLGLTAFFFINSGIFQKEYCFLEIYRYFRTNSFNKIDDFYYEFFEIVKNYNPILFAKHYSYFINLDYLSLYPFYTENDKWFRYIRDQLLTDNQYSNIMKIMFKNKKFDITKSTKNLWINEKELKNIDKQGHVVGLHSHSHPTQMKKLCKSKQRLEYKNNYEHLSKILGKHINTMSHPCGDYNNDTLDILTEMNVDIGFASNMYCNGENSRLTIPREDQANLQQKALL